MGELWIAHWLAIVFVMFLLWLIVRILRKAGFSSWWALLAAIPIVNVICWWVFAFARWPRDSQGT